MLYRDRRMENFSSSPSFVLLLLIVYVVSFCILMKNTQPQHNLYGKQYLDTEGAVLDSVVHHPLEGTADETFTTSLLI